MASELKHILSQLSKPLCSKQQEYYKAISKNEAVLVLI